MKMLPAIPVVLLLLMPACVTTSPRGELTRDAIHWQHTQCQRFVSVVSLRDGDAWRLFECDRAEQAQCLAAGLERQCSEWQSGGM